MTVDVVTFKVAFPEFARNTDAQISFWLTQAVATLNARLLGNQYDLAVMLFAAHYVAGSIQNQQSVANGGVPGQATGPVVSKSVGPVSKTMGTFAVDPRAGQYNNTTYGQRLWALMRATAAGGIYLAPRYRTPAWPSNQLTGIPGYGPGRRW